MTAYRFEYVNALGILSHDFAYGETQRIQMYGELSRDGATNITWRSC